MMILEEEVYCPPEASVLLASYAVQAKVSVLVFLWKYSTVDYSAEFAVLLFYSHPWVRNAASGPRNSWIYTRSV